MTSACPTYKLNNGMEMPVVGLGTWKSPSQQTTTAVKAAIECGYRMIDTANDYGNEADVGVALKECLEAGIVKREDLFIQSKLWNTNHRKEHVKADLLATLEDLQLDYIDSFVIHWPQACPATGKTVAICREPVKNLPFSISEQPTSMFPIDDRGYYCSDNECHFLETWHALEDLIDEGLIKSAGLSNFNIAQVKEILQNVRKHKPVVLQNECHPFYQQKDVVDFCNREGIIFQSYSPLGSGDGPFRTPTDPSIWNNEALEKMAKKHNKTIGHCVLRWHVEKGLSLVPKSVTPSRIKANIDLFDFRLDAEDIKIFDTLNCGWKHCLWPQTSLHPDYPFKESLPYDYVVGKAPINTSGEGCQ